MAILFFKKKNQLKVLIIRLVQTATGCKIKFLESLNGMPLVGKTLHQQTDFKDGSSLKEKQINERMATFWHVHSYTHGAQFLTELAPLCRILCSDGEEYTIYSCIRGKLIEVNENILENPSLLQEKPSTEGYIAVVLPKFEESKKVTQGLLTREEYEEFLSKRFNSTSLCNTKEENSAEV